MPTTQELQAFHRAVLEQINSIEDRVYRPNYFIQLLSELGAYDAAIQVIHSSKIPDGFMTLQQAGRLDLTVEAFVLRPEWSQLFEPETLQLARERLAQFDYQP